MESEKRVRKSEYPEYRINKPTLDKINGLRERGYTFHQICGELNLSFHFLKRALRQKKIKPSKEVSEVEVILENEEN